MMGPNAFHSRADAVRAEAEPVVLAPTGDHLVRDHPLDALSLRSNGSWASRSASSCSIGVDDAALTIRALTDRETGGSTARERVQVACHAGLQVGPRRSPCSPTPAVRRRRRRPVRRWHRSPALGRSPRSAPGSRSRPDRERGRAGLRPSPARRRRSGCADRRPARAGSPAPIACPVTTATTIAGSSRQQLKPRWNPAMARFTSASPLISSSRRSPSPVGAEPRSIRRSRPALKSRPVPLRATTEMPACSPMISAAWPATPRLPWSGRCGPPAG